MQLSFGYLRCISSIEHRQETIMLELGLDPDPDPEPEVDEVNVAMWLNSHRLLEGEEEED